MGGMIKMKRVVFDCDNTMGLKEKDVDDGLVMLYLLGREDVKLEGITTVFGNGTMPEAYRVTNKMLAELEIKDIPVLKGADSEKEKNTPAADWLVKTAQTAEEKLTLLATGPLTNLKAAYKQDKEFFSYFEEIVIMGGVTEPLYFGEQKMDELNFSCDPEAAKIVMAAEVPVMVASGNLCLDALFNEQDWSRLQQGNSPNYQYIADYIVDWYSFGQELIGQQGFYMWDLVSAVYITDSNLFTSCYYYLESTVDDLATGQLLLTATDKSPQASGVVNIPEQIDNADQLKNIIFQNWANFDYKGK